MSTSFYKVCKNFLTGPNDGFPQPFVPQTIYAQKDGAGPLVPFQNALFENLHPSLVADLDVWMEVSDKNEVLRFEYRMIPD